jgi:nucleoside-diphosphate-sugar epimerase
MVKTEDDPLDPTPAPGGCGTLRWPTLTRLSQRPAGSRSATAAPMAAPNDGQIAFVRKRLLPIIGNGEAVTSFIHLDDAAAATVLALEHGEAGVYNIVDDDPAPLREWVPVLANVLGAKPPRRIPAWLARLIAEEGGVILGTQARGASNAKAKRALGWTLRYPSWRQGFVATHASTTPAGREQATSSGRLMRS